MKRKRMESKQLIMAAETVRSTHLKAKINPESLEMCNRTKNVSKLLCDEQTLHLVFRGRGNSEQSFYQK